MLEIELKARVADKKAVEERLAKFMTLTAEVNKHDEYWSVPLATSIFPSSGFRVRVRKEPGKSTVTFKEKAYAGSLEVNQEVEFGILDSKAFEKFLEKMSAKPLYRKRKKGSLWTGEGGIVAELVEVEGLGLFLEVELLREEKVKLDIEKEKAALYDVIKKCGIAFEAVEPRPYSQLLGIPRY
jgi:adenylate cyclase, class 2